MKVKLLGKKNKRRYYIKDKSDLKNDEIAVFDRPTRGRFDSSQCILCRGTKYLCGKSRCPILAKFYSKSRTASLISSENLDGASPPSVFIGRMGYPKINIGPMIPPVHGDTAYMDTPELWWDINIDKLIDFRTSLVRGKYQVKVQDVLNSNKIVEYTREIALAKTSPELEVKFTKSPSGHISLSDTQQPHGPSAPLERISVDNIKLDQRIEKAYFDTDLKAREAVIGLHKNNVLVSSVQKAFSVGAFGLGDNRRFVPTRWSITAVDSMLGEHLMKYTKNHNWINEYRVYENYHLDNRWIVLMMPSEWCYELIEAWYPETAWNPSSSRISIISSHEHNKGRTTYAEIGGCYYAARLAVNEKLTQEQRQAGVVIFRESHPGYILPVGVWNVRENVRKALINEPMKFDNIEFALEYISSKMDIPIPQWIKHSAIMQEHMFQSKLEDFF